MTTTIEKMLVLTGKDEDGVPYEISIFDIRWYALRSRKEVLTSDQLNGIIAWATDHPVQFGSVAKMIAAAH